MITVPTNTVSYLFRFILLPFIFWLNYVPVSRLILGYYSDTDNIIVFFIGLPFFMFFLTFLLLSFFGVFHIEVNLTIDEVSIRKAFRSETIRTIDIQGYYLTSFSTKWKDYEGLFLKLKNGKTIELSEYNLDSLYEFNQYLIEKKIPCMGRKRTWFPLSRNV